LCNNCKGSYGTVTNNSTILQVSADDEIKIKAEVSKDTTFGDNLNVFTLYNESTLNIMYYDEL